METSNEFNGETLFDLTSFVAVTHASLSAPQENETEPMTHGICGPGYLPPLANFDPDTQSWKMYGDTYLWGDSPLLETLPPSGMTQNGVLFPQPAWEPITAVTDSSLWPTPRASTAMGEKTTVVQSRLHNGEPYKAKLEQAVAMWPTPTYGKLAGGTGGMQQIEAQYLLGNINSEERRAMRAGNGGRLNPMWVEWLMGFPPGWTDLEDSETP
jgi:hypothetical protein